MRGVKTYEETAAGFDYPLRPAPARPVSLPRRLVYQLAQDLPDDPEFEDELVEGLLGRQAMSVIYGDSNSGKTFLAIDLAASVCLGMPWMGRNVEPSLVVYLATEAPRSVRERLKAYRPKHRDESPARTDFGAAAAPSTQRLRATPRRLLPVSNTHF